MRRASLLPIVTTTLLLGVLPAGSQEKKEQLFLDPIDVKVPHISTDKTIKYDYDIVYVRAPRFVKSADGKERPSAWPEIGHPYNISAGYDLMLLHPDGSEELLVKGGDGSVTDPYVSFDAEWVYYAYFHNPAREAGAGRSRRLYHGRSGVRTFAGVPWTHPSSRELDAGEPNRRYLPFARAAGSRSLGPCPVGPPKASHAR